MSDLEDFKLGGRHNAGDPEGRRVMTPPVAPVASEPRTELGRTLKELRGQAIADGMPLSSLEELRGEPVTSKSVDVQAITDALDYAHDCAAQEFSEARRMYGQYPRDGLGRKITQAEEQLAVVQEARAAIVAYGDAQWNAGREVGAQAAEEYASNFLLADHIRGLKR